MNHFSAKIGKDILVSTALFDLIKDPVFLMEKDHDSFRYVYVNPSGLAMLPLQEVIGSRIEEVFLPELSQKIIRQYRKVQTTRKPIEFTERIEIADSEFIGETMLNPILGETEQCTYILAIVRDVTERERKKTDLQKRQKESEIERTRLNSLVENNAYAVFEFDQQKNFISINKKVNEATGFSEEELLGQSIVSLVVDSYLEETLANFEKALKGDAVEFETTIRKKNQQIAIFQVNTIPIIIEEKVIGIYAIAKEITEQKKMERLLRESEQRYKSLFDNHPYGIFTFDRTGNLESINAGSQNITGYPITELLPKSFLSVIIPEETEKVRHHFYKAINEKRPERYELTFRHKNGQLIDLQAMNIPIIVDEQVVGIHGIVTDITEMNRAQKALTETKEELEVFWENSTDPIFYIDTKGDILKVNPAFEETFGYTEEEMTTGKGTIIPQHMKTAQFDVIDRLVKGETVTSHETIRITKTGKPLNIISSYSPVRNADKEIIGATIIYKNVTELKKAEAELQKSQEKYKLITESTFDIITLINLSGLIEYVSPANEKILGYPDHTYIGSPFTTNVHPEDAFDLMESVTSLIDGGKPVPVEIRFLHKDGHYIWMEVSPTPVLAEGEVKQLFTIARDITERRRLQDKIAKMAFYDHLSGIPNRRTFDDKLQKAIDQANHSGKKVAVLLLDGRKFKQINDQFGHDAGDAVIKEMAVRLQDCVRPIDTAARLGGDEMGVILPEIDSLEIAENTAKRILKSFETPLIYNGFEIPIGAGIGISLYPDDTTNEKQLIKYADMALYEAKKSDQDAYRIYK
ncbi:PAS domain S-box protein [Planomicrobium sp. CPCC 101079]|uniref:PAS domain S-box protein n=1 Tax=Planomicrobium sp. CPCC 101079 TaxID=2599618 RepID=UPI0011B67D0E|nr:PAS domain S-box protein [Planomicrobium sp. CPCC 101079]TWT01891.1 PAS domain S-box protein [Planomicrobium sp. CPCC 101079]